MGGGYSGWQAIDCECRWQTGIQSHMVSAQTCLARITVSPIINPCCQITYGNTFITKASQLGILDNLSHKAMNTHSFFHYSIHVVEGVHVLIMVQSQYHTSHNTKVLKAWNVYICYN